MTRCASWIGSCPPLCRHSWGVYPMCTPSKIRRGTAATRMDTQCVPGVPRVALRHATFSISFFLFFCIPVYFHLSEKDGNVGAHVALGYTLRIGAGCSRATSSSPSVSWGYTPIHSVQKSVLSLHGPPPQQSRSGSGFLIRRALHRRPPPYLPAAAAPGARHQLPLDPLPG